MVRRGCPVTSVFHIAKRMTGCNATGIAQGPLQGMEVFVDSKQDGR